MAEAAQVLLLVIIVVAVYILARMIKTWRAGRACSSIIRELETSRAYDPDSAVELRDVQRDLLRAGVRNFRPEGLQMLLLNDVVAPTAEGRYYLKNARALQVAPDGEDGF